MEPDMETPRRHYTPEQKVNILRECIGSASIGKNRGLSYGMGGLVLMVDFAL
jgi:hypothetical protein